MAKFAQKIGADKNYKRPKTTYQEQLTVAQVEEKLQGYQKVTVDELAEVPLNTHMRYFVDENGDAKFRTGGFLDNKQNCDTYIILTNGKVKWSVQVKGAIFYKKMSQKEEIETIRSEYDKKIEEYKKKLAKKNELIEELRFELEQAIAGEPPTQMRTIYKQKQKQKPVLVLAPAPVPASVAIPRSRAPSASAKARAPPPSAKARAPPPNANARAPTKSSRARANKEVVSVELIPATATATTIASARTGTSTVKSTSAKPPTLSTKKQN